MPFVQALYFPRLDANCRQSPPPRIVRLEVVPESHTWHADVRAFLKSCEVEKFIIDGPTRELDERHVICAVCGEGQDACICSPVSEKADTEWPLRRRETTADTSYMMTFAAITSMNEYNDDEPLLDREVDEEPTVHCWTRDFLFFKLSNGFPIDIGTSQGYGNCPTIMARDIEFLQIFFEKLVQDKDLVRKRFSLGSDEETCPIKSMKHCGNVDQHCDTFNENIKSSSDLGHNDFLLAGGFTASGPLCIHRTQQGRHRPNSLNLQRLRSDSPVPTLKLTRSMSNETLKLTKSPSAPISAHQGRLPFTSKSRRRRDPQDIEKANGYASVSSRRNWLHIV